DHISAKEHTSVPYAVGYLVERLIKEYLAQPKPKPIPEETSLPVEIEKTPVPEKTLVCKRVWWKLFLGKTCHWEYK
nr:hypothetical protein [Lachnospiraceae bacterium]